MIITSISDAIGNTPMLSFSENEYSMPKGSTIYAKLEYLNPGGSIKDRLGKKLIEKALEKKLIDRSSTIIEPTAGNTGIGLALAASQYGIKTLFVIPEKFSIEKQQLMKALGAEIIHTPTEDGIVGAITKAKELNSTISNSYLPLQFENFDNPLTYYETLGPEIFYDVGTKISSFVAGIGSGGTFAGVSQYLLEQVENIRIVGVEPEGSILNGGVSHGHEIEGIGVEFIPPFLGELPVHQFFTISDEEGFYYTRELAKNNGLFVGSSSGAAFAAALKEINQLPPGSTVVTIFPDASDRYLSKNIYL